jgi:cation:H+ antiporter
MLLPSLPLWVAVLVFVGCAVAIWIAGISLSNYTDVLADRLHLGSALGGLILLAVATNLPEIAITVTAARNGQVDVAVSNLLGGIAIQTVVLVALDAFGVRVRRPLTYQAASLQLVLEGAAVVAVLTVVVMGAQLPRSAISLRLTPDVVAIAAAWLLGLLLTQRAAKLPWQDNGNAPDAQPEPRGHSARARAADATKKGVSTGKALTVFGAAAAVTLVAGALLEESGSQAADRVGLSGVLFGATVLAARRRCRSCRRESPPCAAATTSSRSETSSGATRSCPCCCCSQRSSAARRSCPTRTTATSTSLLSGRC